MNAGRSIIIAICLLVLAVGSADSRSLPEDNRTTALKSAAPAYCNADHRVGRLILTVSNNGTIGTGFAQGGKLDCFTGEELVSAEFPAGSGQSYLFAGALWVGAVVNGDTLVSVGADGWQVPRELVPDEVPFGLMEKLSTLDPMTADEATSELDYIATFSDTLVPGINDQHLDVIDGRPHMPLNLSVTRKSYSWSQSGLRDMVFMEYFFKNIGNQQLTELYIGHYVDGDVGPEGDFGAAQDDITGYLRTSTHSIPCVGEIEDAVNTAWIADNDGDPEGSSFTSGSAPHVTGMRVLSAGPAQQISYNWWISNGTPHLDFGPRHKDNPRDFGTGGRGTPEGDRNKYYVMRNGEIDYDQVFTGTVTQSDTLWEYPPQDGAIIWSRALDTRYLLSAGPYNLPPGDTLRWMVVYMAGEDFHRFPTNFETNLQVTYNPQAYYNSIDFSDLGDKARLAANFYDTPGIDTDSDGYAGEHVFCEGDTIWTKGDGIPDWRATVPPQPPTVWAEKSGNNLSLRFNGKVPETEKDRILNVNQFEGYVVYLKEAGASDQPQRIGGYDRENYVKFYYSALSGWSPDYKLYTLEDLRCEYGANCNDTDFYPLVYTPSKPYTMPGPPDSLFYFERYGFNQPLGGGSGVYKRYPAQPYPSTLDPASADPAELTDDGYFKYFEYGYTVDGLQPEKNYLVGVTTVEYGAPGRLTPDAESSLNLIQPTEGACCIGMRGDINGDGDDSNSLDLAFLVDFLFAGGVAPSCLAEANINGSSDGLNSLDLAMLVDFLWNGGAAPAACP